MSIKIYYSLIVGSSNLTDHALKANYEWNVFLTSMEDGEVIHHFKNQFEDAWQEAIPLTEQWITNYKLAYERQPYVDDKTLNSIENIFSLNFHVANDKKKFGFKPIIEVNSETYQFNEDIQVSLQNDAFKAFVTDIVACAHHKNKQYDKTRPLTLYKKYSRRDACRLLNWTNDDSSTIYGYRTKHGTCPIFVTYHKKEVESSVDYGDEFLSPDVFRWFTRSKLTLQSNEVKNILAAETSGIAIHLFAKKDDGEGFDFYYMGTSKIIADSPKEETMYDKNGKEISVVTMNMVLEQPVQYDIYHYLVEE